MKGKIPNSFKPPLTKRPLGVDHWKLNEMQGSGECLRQQRQFLNFLDKII